jgi:CelD/BcsL family acetyltransferase involved in cellulose biosynthesis
VEVSLVSQPEEFAALHSAWNTLQRRLRRPSPFLTHEWFDAAWQWRNQGTQLHVLCCRRGQDVVGVLPLLRQTPSVEHGSSRTLKFLAVPDTQVCDVLAADADRLPVASALADELVRRQREWDAIALNYLPDGAIALTELRQALSRHGLRCDIRQATQNPWIALNSDWETYYSSRSRRLKKAVNLATNRLSKTGDVGLHWLQPGEGDAAEVDSQIDRITAISARSWKTSTGNSLDNAGPQAFVRRLSQHAHRMRCLSVWTLTLNKTPIAMELQLIDDGCVFALRSDFDAAYEAISPGSYLNRYMLAKLFGRGLRRYLMGPGENIYKYRWADEAEPVGTMTIYGHSMRGRWLAARELVLKPAARRIRDVFRPPRSKEAAPPETSNLDNAT